MSNSLKISSVSTSIFIHVAVFGILVNASSRIMQLPLDFGFDIKRLNTSTVFGHNKTVVCMFDSWSYWRNNEGKFRISDTDPSLCTQLVYRNARLNKETFEVKIHDPYLAETLGWYRQSVALGTAHSHLKVLLSVGGYNEGSSTFSTLAADYEKRAKFIESVLRVLKKFGFHGIDLAWEYPAWTSMGGNPADKNNLPILAKELKEVFGKKYLLTLTTPGNPYFISPGYDIRALSKLVDQFNIRTFDFSGAWDNKAYHHSALKDTDAKNSVMRTVGLFLDNGAPADKIVVGIPFYGRTFLLTETANLNNDSSIESRSGLGLEAEGGFAGDLVKDAQLLGYHEICKEFKGTNREEWSTFRDNLCMVPFARSERRWLTFDDIQSIHEKASFVRNNQLKGVMAWTIDTDDFRGTACRDQDHEPVSFPLLRTLNRALTHTGNEEFWSEMNDLPDNSNQDNTITRNTNSRKQEEGVSLKSSAGTQLLAIRYFSLALMIIQLLLSTE